MSHNKKLATLRRPYKTLMHGEIEEADNIVGFFVSDVLKWWLVMSLLLGLVSQEG